MRSCGRFGPAMDGTTVRQIQRQRVRINRLRRAIDAEQSLLLRIGFHQSDLLRRAIGHAQIIQRR